MTSLTLELHFAKGYIAHPYWPELEKVINIEKESGTRRARSEANRARALEDYLKKVGLTLDKFNKLKIAAARPFYTNGRDGEIIIPEHQIYGMLAAAADEARSGVRIASRDQIRSAIQVMGPMHTGKTKADGCFERFAVVTAGTGAKLSNQRALRQNDYISDFSGTLTMSFDPAMVDPKRLRDFIAYAGREIGIGASRKLGWGRFSIVD